jgi:hypothetical protein
MIRSTEYVVPAEDRATSAMSNSKVRQEMEHSHSSGEQISTNAKKVNGNGRSREFRKVFTNTKKEGRSDDECRTDTL